ADRAIARLRRLLFRRAARSARAVRPYADEVRRFPCVRKRPWDHPTGAVATESSRVGWRPWHAAWPGARPGRTASGPRPEGLLRAGTCPLWAGDPCLRTTGWWRGR